VKFSKDLNQCMTDGKVIWSLRGSAYVVPCCYKCHRIIVKYVIDIIQYLDVIKDSLFGLGIFLGDEACRVCSGAKYLT
jgi:hypothetical protein